MNGTGQENHSDLIYTTSTTYQLLPYELQAVLCIGALLGKETLRKLSIIGVNFTVDIRLNQMAFRKYFFFRNLYLSCQLSAIIIEYVEFGKKFETGFKFKGVMSMCKKEESNVNGEIKKIYDDTIAKIGTIITNESPEARKDRIGILIRKYEDDIGVFEDFENTYVGLNFKKSLRDTLVELQNGYFVTKIMYILTFGLGFILILGGLYLAITANKDLFGIFLTGVGGTDILLFFLSDPPAKLEFSRNNFAKFIVPYYTWHIEVVNRHDLLDKYRQNMISLIDSNSDTLKNNVNSLSQKINDQIKNAERLGNPNDPKKGEYLNDLKNQWNEIVEMENKCCNSLDGVQQIWTKIFEMEIKHSMMLLDDTNRVMQMMAKIKPMQSTMQSKGETTTPKTYTITAIAGEGGTINPPNSTTIDEGDSQPFTIEPNAGYIIDQLKVNDNPLAQGDKSTYEFKDVHGDQKIEASFTKLPAAPAQSYTITAIAGVGGDIDPKDAVSVNEGDSKTFNIKPESGYKLDQLKVNDKPQVQGGKLTYEFMDVRRDQKIEASFVKET
jgi:hypothetical protein